MHLRERVPLRQHPGAEQPDRPRVIRALVFGLSFTEVLIIAVLALVLLGPEQLPGAARTAGKWMRELRRATEDLKDQIETEIYVDERKARPSLVPPVPAAQVPQAAAPP